MRRRNVCIHLDIDHLSTHQTRDSLLVVDSLFDLASDLDDQLYVGIQSGHDVRDAVVHQVYYSVEYVGGRDAAVAG